MKKCLSQFIIATAMLLEAFVISSRATAQITTYPYIVNFEYSTTDSTSPLPTKTDTNMDTILVNGAKWVMPGVKLGGVYLYDNNTGPNGAEMRLLNNNTKSYMELLKI